MINIGKKELVTSYIGAKEVSSIYIGNKEVFTSFTKGLVFKKIDGEDALEVSYPTIVSGKTDVIVPKKYYETDDDGKKIGSVRLPVRRIASMNIGITSIQIPDTVTIIGSLAFDGCTKLSSIIIPDSVTTIERQAFHGCNKLVSIEIGNGVLSIGSSAFSSCNLLKDIYIKSIKNWCSIDFETASSSPLSYRGNLFLNKQELTDVVIPNDITEIKRFSFYKCNNLKSITIPNSVTTIGGFAFYDCDRLESITIGNSVDSIKQSAFDGCDNLNNITVPNSVTSIEDRAFAYCIKLTNITIGDSVETIGSSVFSNCTALTKIVIPNSVESIGNGVFSNCSLLTEITVPFIGEKKDGSGDTYFGYIFGEDNTTVPNSLKDVVLTGSTIITENAFSQCSHIESINIPGSIKTIGSNAFSECSSLKKVKIDSINTWLEINFANAASNPLSSYYESNESGDDDGIIIGGKQFTRLSFSNADNQDILPYSFYYYKPLKSIILKNNTDKYVTPFDYTNPLSHIFSIGTNAFAYCSNLDDISIKNYCGMKIKFGADAFKEFGPSDREINFSYFPYLKKSCWQEYININTFKFIRESFSEWWCSSNIERENEYSTPLTNKETIFYIKTVCQNSNYEDTTTTKIGDINRFIDDDLPEYDGYYGYEIEMSLYNDSFNYGSETYYLDHIEEFDNYSFAGYKNITTLGDSINPIKCSTIGNKAFAYSGVTNLFFNISLESIGENAFLGCSLSDSYYSGTKAKWDTLNIHESNSIKENIICSSESLTFTEMKGQYSYYRVGVIDPEATNIIIPPVYSHTGSLEDALPVQVIGELSCKKLSYIFIPNSIVAIENNAFSGCTELEDIEFPEGLKTIGSKSFYQCSSLKDLYIPSSVTTIGDSAFYGCNNLSSINIVNEVQSLGSNIFAECYNITKATIHSSLISILVNKGSLTEVIISSGSSIYDNAFMGCTNLKSVTIRYSVTSIGNWAFANCTKLNSISISNSVTSIGQDAFFGCASLTNISIPDSVTYIGNYAFSNCEELTSFIIPEKIEIIYSDTFLNCTKLSEITIGSSVTRIQESAFYNCSSLTNIVIPESVSFIGSSVFYGCSDLSSVTFKKTVGWSAGGVSIRQNDLSDPATAATYLTETYVEASWERTDYNEDEYTNSEVFNQDSLNDGQLSINQDYRESIESLKIQPDCYGCSSISENGFENCVNLKTVYIPKIDDNIVPFTISTGAFSGCSSLESITINNYYGIVIIEEPIVGIDSQTKIYVPSGSLEIYIENCPQHTNQFVGITEEEPT